LDSDASEALDHLLKLEAPIEAVFEGGGRFAREVAEMQVIGISAECRCDSARASAGPAEPPSSPVPRNSILLPEIQTFRQSSVVRPFERGAAVET
jgi:hypothetical protein